MFRRRRGGVALEGPVRTAAQRNEVEANMNAPLAKEQIALLMSDSLTYGAIPVQGSDATSGQTRSSFTRRISAVIQYLMELPRRRAVIDELSRLTDRELADIGLTRAGLKQVFANAR
jgi:uncharacterized protein YjiS (DUF1127 family)